MDDKNQDFQQGYDFSSFQHTRSFSFGPRSSSSLALELSLTGLFDCLTLECSSSLVHPQWKHFRHMGMQRSDRIRLNNGIWRSWHLQYLKDKTSKFVCFSTPNIAELETNYHMNPHNRPKTIVLEGKYWRRNQKAVAKEYMKWRLYYKDKWKKVRLSPNMEEFRAQLDAEEKLINSSRQVQAYPCSVPGLPFDTEGMMDITDDDLLSSDPFGTGLDDIHIMGTADVIQPRLDQLNPMFEDFLNSLDMSEVMPQLARAGNQSSSNLTKPGSFQFLGSNRPGLQLIPTETASQQPMVSGTLHADIAPLIQRTMDEEIDLQQHEGPILMYDQETGIISGNSGESSGYAPHTKPTSMYAGNVQQLMQVEEDPASVARQFVDEVTGVTSSSIGHHTDSSSSPLVSPVNTSLSHSSQHPYSISPLHSVTPSSQFEQSTPRVHPQPSRTASAPANVNRPFRRRKSKTSISSSPTRSTDPYPQQPQQHQISMATVPQLLQRSQTEPTITDMSVSSPIKQLNHSRRESFDHMRRSMSGGVLSHSTTRPTRSSYPEIAPKIEAQSITASGVPTGPLSSACLMPMVQVTLQSTPQSSSMHLQTSSAHPPTSIYTASGMGVSGLSAQVPSSHQPLNMTSMIQQLLGALSEAPELLPKILDVVESHKKSQQRETQSTGSGFVTLQPESHATTHSSVASQHQPYTIPLQEAQFRAPQVKPSVQQDVPHQDFFSPVQTTPVVPHQQQSVSPPNVQQRSTSSTPGAAPTSGAFDFQTKMILIAAQQTGIDGSGLAAAVNAGNGFQGPQFCSPSVPFVIGVSPQDDQTSPLAKDHRRQSHITAEQKRRGNIKLGFEHLHQLLPSTCGQPVNKTSKASMLQKATEYVVQLKREKRSMEEEVRRLHQEIESLNTTINMCQEQLPASGVPVSRQRFTQMQQTFQQYVREQTARNFKFWIFSVIIRPLFESYNNTVSTRNVEEMCQTVLTWLEQKCSLPRLRPSVLESLRELSTTTSILSDPTSISKAAAEVVGEPPVSLQRPL